MKSWQKGDGAPDGSSDKTTTIMLAVTTVIAVIGIVLFIYLAYMAIGLLDKHINPTPAGYDIYGHIQVNTDKLARTDPIVAIWQSHDGAIDGWPFIKRDYLLIFYNDNTYAFYDLVNTSYKKGMWTKKEDVNTNYYTLSDGTLMPYSEVAHGVPSSGYFQLTLYEEGTQPDARIGYIDYELVDYDPLMPDTVSKLNNRSLW